MSYIKEALNQSQLLKGREDTPAEMATEFARMKPMDRVQILSAIGKESSDLNVREAAKTLQHERALRDMHQRLLEVDR